jgi:propanediol dehydratase small subunit
MTKCEILKDFTGSQDGIFATDFTAGEIADLSDYLMGCIDKSWVKVISQKNAAEISNKAVITDGKNGGKK